MGLERAGWRTVSFSEIDPYACAVLAERWPGVPNLGSIIDVVGDERTGDDRRFGPPPRAIELGRDTDPERLLDADGWQSATLWTGGFPCQDLSIAGKRRGLDGARSGLAFAYLGLVERHRPPWVLLENVPGLLSSNRGRDLSVLLGRLSELGYGVAYRVLDARYFGVAQRRRRVFILASRDPGGRAGAERAASVLSVASRGGGHPAPSCEAGAGTTGGVDDGTHGPSLYNATAAFGDWEPGSEAGTLSRRDYKSTNHLLLTRPPDDAGGQGRRRRGSAAIGEREPDAGHEQQPGAVRGAADDDLAATVTGSYGTKWNGNAGATSGGNFALSPSPHAGRDGAPDGLAGRSHDRQELAPVWQGHGSNVGPFGAVRAGNGNSGGGVPFTTARDIGADDPLLPLGLDSHRYRCCGNGVVSNVAEALGRALASEIA